MKRPTIKMWKQLFRSMIPHFFFGKKKILLAFEYGLVMADVAEKMKYEITPEVVKRAEEIVMDQCQKSSTQEMAVDMVPNILAIFQPN